MSIERWGSLSIRDHTSPEALVPELVLYDRLVMPVWQPDDDRREWQDPLWDRKLQAERIRQLGDLIISRPWNNERRQVYKNRLEELLAMRHDAIDMVEEVRKELGYQLTRRILAEETLSELPPGVVHVDVVSAYPSEAAFTADFLFSPEVDDTAHAALLIGQRLAVPIDRDPEKALKKTIALVRSRDFRKKRRALHRWQRDTFAEGVSPESSVEELEQLVDDYNQAVGEATGLVKYRIAFLIGGAALTMAAAPGSLLAGASALLSIIGFATLDRKPVVNAGEAAPAALFHDVQTKLGVKFGVS